jgi:hypothetical protein
MFKKNLYSILFAIIISTIILMAIFPNLMFGNYHFMNAHDPATHYNNFLQIFSELKNGGIQFWNIYDLTSTFFVQLSYGIYNFQNFITALIFFFFNYFSNFNYHSFYSFTFFFIGIVIRSFGFFILFKYIISNYNLAIFGTIVANIFITYHLNIGLVTSNLLSYLPILLFIILKIFDKKELNYFLFLILLSTICIANSPLMTLGYFYMTVHAFLLSLFVINFYNKKFHFFKFTNNIIFNRKNLIKIFFTIFISLLIILPYLLMLKYLSSDYFIPNSGLQGTSGRLNQILNPHEYFSKEIYTNNFHNFLSNVFNYKYQKWQYSWPFFNNFIIFFSLIGMIFSKNLIKYPFIFTIIFLLCLNFPNDPKSIFSLFHWITVLTNPFSFLLRSFHMVNLIIPFFIAPLFLLGVKESFLLYKKYDEINIYKFFIFLILYNLFSFLILELNNSFYLLLSNITIFLIFFSLKVKNKIYRKIFSLIFFILLILIEVFFLSKYINIINPNHMQLITTNNSYLINQSDPQNKVLQNTIMKSLPENYTKYYTPWANPLFSGSYYNVIHFNNYKKSYLYNPIHKSLENLHDDLIIQNYITKNKELISFKANVYIKENNFLYKYDKNLKLNNRYFFLNNRNEQIPYNFFISDKLAKNINKDVFFDFSLPFENDLYVHEKKDDYYQVTYDLPVNFPKNLNTSYISKNLTSAKLQIQTTNNIIDFKTSNLNKNFYFNVNDIKKNKLIFNIPHEHFNKINKIYLSFLLDFNYLNLSKENNDTYMFNYYSKNDGYLVINMPFDEKWNIKVNDKISDIFIANKYFMAIKIKKGDNIIVMDYMNESFLRNLIYLSVFLIFICLIYVHYSIIRNNLN